MGVAAHAAVTLASHRRQQDGHAAARVLDARSLRLAPTTDPEPADHDGTGPLAARVDALVGPAADALGPDDAPVAARLLDTADDLDRSSWRPRVLSGRLGWSLRTSRRRAHRRVFPSCYGAQTTVDASGESVNDRVGGAARRRHAAALTVDARYQLSDPVGRGLMGESVWILPGPR